MSSRPTKEQITEAMHHAAWAARERTRDPDRIAEFPRGVDDCEQNADMPARLRRKRLGVLEVCLDNPP
jgi:hypothetical protein